MNPCTDEQGKYRYEPNYVVPEISTTQCENLQNNVGLNGDATNNCGDIQSLVCDIKQEVDILASNKIMVVAPNDTSKCQDDNDPTLASMWSRILRFAQAVTCMLCTYDPRLATLLTSGKYPQILMGNSDGTGFPRWVTPDSKPQEGSEKTVTSAGIYQAIQDAILSVWHLWQEQPEFDYFAQSLNDPNDPHNLQSQMTATPATNGDTALVASGTEGTSLLYTYNNGTWEFTRVLDNATDNLTNFATTHINKGFYATKGVYYFDGTWQVMDADISDIEEQINELLQLFRQSVISGGDDEYILTTAPTLTQAQAVSCDPDKSTIVLITG